MAERYGDESLVQDSRLKLKDMKVKQLLYVTDDIKGIFYKLSQLQIRPYLNMNEIPERWYMIIGEEKQISASDLFIYNSQSRSFNWEIQDVASDELNMIVSQVEHRHNEISQEEEEKEKLRLEQEKIRLEIEKLDEERIRENQRIQEQRNHIRQQRTQDHLDPDSRALVTKNQINSIDELIKHYREVLDKIKASDVIESSPGFKSRVTDCEEDIRIYESTGQLPNRIYTHIQMMKYALHIN